LASGDAFVISQEAGNGNSWSYTATADLVITCYGFNSTDTFRLGTWVSSTSGVLTYILGGSPTATNASQFNKVILKSGSTITADTSNVNVYGVYIGGFEL
jgi:hypothetical protein